MRNRCLAKVSSKMWNLVATGDWLCATSIDPNPLFKSILSINKDSSLGPTALLRDIAHHRAKHAVTRFPPAGLPEARAEVLCRRRQWYKKSQWWNARSSALANNPKSPKVYRREG
jgi:hypothetical protein